MHSFTGIHHRTYNHTSCHERTRVAFGEWEGQTKKRTKGSNERLFRCFYVGFNAWEFCFGSCFRVQLTYRNALEIELSSTGFANLRFRAPPHVHPRSPGLVLVFAEGPTKSFIYLKKVRNKKVTGPGRPNSQGRRSSGSEERTSR